jgi:hypothetical protein
LKLHVVTFPREETITVKFQGKVFEVRMGSDGAFIPEPLALHMCALGLVGRGDKPDPRPEWETLPGGGHGDLIEKYSRYVREIPKSDLDEAAAQPKAIAAILRKGKA